MSATRRSGLVALGAAIAVLALLLVTLPATAWAKPYEHEHFEDSYSEIIEDFCGLTVRIDEQVTGHFLLAAQGKHRLAYAVENVRGTWSVTNLATNKSFTQAFTVTTRDLKVTDNGDGTLTILVLATGNERWYGPDGQLLFKNPGQIRFEVLIDHGGTPADPSDDEFIDFLGVVKDSTGRNDLDGRDFCEDLHTFTG